MCVIVITPALNKSFKFESNWPYNSTQVYILSSILDNIKDDSNRSFELVNDGYKFNCKVNFPNNTKLTNAEIIFSKSLDISSVKIKDSDGNIVMNMKFDKINYSKKFDEDYFKLSSIVDEVETEDTTDENKEEESTNDSNTEDTSETSSILEDTIYPMYIPENTRLTSEEKVTTENGERLILTFSGDNPFTVIEETVSIPTYNEIINTSGDIEFLTDVIGIVKDKSVSFETNGTSFYLVSDTLETEELIEVAKSISVLPVSK